MKTKNVIRDRTGALIGYYEINKGMITSFTLDGREKSTQVGNMSPEGISWLANNLLRSIDQVSSNTKTS